MVANGLDIGMNCFDPGVMFVVGIEAGNLGQVIVHIFQHFPR